MSWQEQTLWTFLGALLIGIGIGLFYGLFGRQR